MASISNRVRMEHYDELKLENQLLRERMDKLEKYINGLDQVVSGNSSSSDDANIDQMMPPNRKRSLKCSKCDEQFKSLLLLAKHKCIRSANNKRKNQLFSSTKIPIRLNPSSEFSSLSSSSLSFRSNSISSGYEMSSNGDAIERMGFSDSIEPIDLTECSMDEYETAHSINSSGRRASFSAIYETDESSYETASSNISAELQMDETSNNSSESFERPCGDLRLPENMPYAVDSLFDSYKGIPVIRNANFPHANNSQIINGVVYDRNVTTLNAPSPTLVEKEFDLSTFVQSKTPLLSEIVPTWSIAVEPFKEYEPCSHESQNSSPSMPSLGGLIIQNESLAASQESIDEQMDFFDELPNISQSPFNTATKQLSENQAASSASELLPAFDSTADSGMDSLGFGETTYRSVFSSSYMINTVERIVNKRKVFSISKFLPLSLKMAVCECCLCCIRHKDNLQIALPEQFCVCLDPLKRKCSEKFSGRKLNSASKNSNSSCRNCLSMLVTSSKRDHRTKLIKCRMVPCNFTATHPYAMEEHYKKHLNIKKFACIMCDRGFQTKSMLRKHARSHLKSRQFSFSRSSSSVGNPFRLSIG